MTYGILKHYLAILLLCICLPGISQENPDTAKVSVALSDTIRGVTSGKTIVFGIRKNPPVIRLTTSEAIRLLENWHDTSHWKKPDDPLRIAIGQLLSAASYSSFDSVEYFLKDYPYDSLSVPWDKFYIWQPVKDSSAFNKNLNDSSLLKAGETVADSLTSLSAHLKAQNDTTVLMIIDTLNAVTPKYSKFPFREFKYPYQSDSIRTAVQQLLDYVIAKDSSVIKISGSGKAVTPVWMNSKTDLMSRYWLKNDMNDSVTVWIGTPSRNNISLYLEKGVNFRKPVKSDDVFAPKIDIKPQDRSRLLAVQKIMTKRQDWKYRTESSFQFSQSSLSNWVKGGENSVTMATDITGYANYNNPEHKVISNNFARMQFGFIASGSNPMRKNLDLIETNSKLNHKAFGKFDFSAIMLFKTQLAPGKMYKKIAEGVDTGIVVSKFFNPAILTMGVGLDYKPNKMTSINFSPLSYKGTFVPDTAHIDGTKYGVPKGKRSKIEPGASFMISNTMTPFRNLTLTNRLQLFTNYINNPQNIDVDWEMIAVTDLNWFTQFRLNTHLIFDDDTKTTVMEGGNPTNRQTARIQWKEMIGISFVFKF
jgi:hypothetical protein